MSAFRAIVLWHSRMLEALLLGWVLLASSPAGGADTPADIYKKIAPAIQYLLLNEDEVVTWTLTPPVSASYDVFARWVALPGSSDSARYRIHHAGGISDVTRNQQLNG